MEPKMVRRAADGIETTDRAGQARVGIPFGTEILTQTGLVPVEALAVGDRIDTRNGGFQPLLSVSEHTQTHRAIRFTQASLAPAQPTRDLILPDTQPVLIRGFRARYLFGQNEAMIRAGQLVDDATVLALGPRRFVLNALDLGRARIVHAGGLDLGTTDAASTPNRAVA